MKCKVVSRPVKNDRNFLGLHRNINYTNKLSDIKEALKKAYDVCDNEETYKTDKLSLIKANICQYHSIL